MSYLVATLGIRDKLYHLPFLVLLVSAMPHLATAGSGDTASELLVSMGSGTNLEDFYPSVAINSPHEDPQGPVSLPTPHHVHSGPRLHLQESGYQERSLPTTGECVLLCDVHCILCYFQFQCNPRVI